MLKSDKKTKTKKTTCIVLKKGRKSRNTETYMLNLRVKCSKTEKTLRLQNLPEWNVPALNTRTCINYTSIYRYHPTAIRLGNKNNGMLF